jgi:hypothetical protein
MNRIEILPKAVLVYGLSFLGFKDLTLVTSHINHWFQVNFNIEECYSPTHLTPKELNEKVYIRLFSNYTQIKAKQWSKYLKVLHWPDYISNTTTACMKRNRLCSIIPYTIPRVHLQYRHHSLFSSNIEYLKTMSTAISTHCLASTIYTSSYSVVQAKMYFERRCVLSIICAAESQYILWPCWLQQKRVIIHGLLGVRLQIHPRHRAMYNTYDCVDSIPPMYSYNLGRRLLVGHNCYHLNITRLYFTTL